MLHLLRRQHRQPAHLRIGPHCVTLGDRAFLQGRTLELILTLNINTNDLGGSANGQMCEAGNGLSSLVFTIITLAKYNITCLIGKAQ